MPSKTCNETAGRDGVSCRTVGGECCRSNEREMLKSGWVKARSVENERTVLSLCIVT